MDRNRQWKKQWFFCQMANRYGVKDEETKKSKLLFIDYRINKKYRWKEMYFINLIIFWSLFLLYHNLFFYAFGLFCFFCLMILSLMIDWLYKGSMDDDEEEMELINTQRETDPREVFGPISGSMWIMKW